MTAIARSGYHNSVCIEFRSCLNPIKQRPDVFIRSFAEPAVIERRESFSDNVPHLRLTRCGILGMPSTTRFSLGINSLVWADAKAANNRTTPTLLSNLISRLQCAKHFYPPLKTTAAYVLNAPIKRKFQKRWRFHLADPRYHSCLTSEFRWPRGATQRGFHLSSCETRYRGSTCNDVLGGADEAAIFNPAAENVSAESSDLLRPVPEVPLRFHPNERRLYHLP